MEGPAPFVFWDNQSAFANTTNPGSSLKMKCVAVAYHLVHEAVASRDEIITAYQHISIHISLNCQNHRLHKTIFTYIHHDEFAVGRPLEARSSTLLWAKNDDRIVLAYISGDYF